MIKLGLNKNGQGTIAAALIMSTALLSSVVVVQRIQSSNAKKAALDNTVSIHGHYMNELMSWHTYQMDVVGAPLSGPSGTKPGRFLAEIQPNTKVPLEGLPSDNVIPPDSYGANGYVDGTPVNIKVTSRFDTAQVIMQPKILNGLEMWKESVSIYGKHCSSTTVSDSSATKSCLSQQVLPPVVDLRVNGLNGPVTVPHATSVTLGWTSSNATSCAFTPAIGSTAVNGSHVTGNLVSSVTYSVTCTGLGGSASDQVIVNVTPPPPISARIVLRLVSGGSWLSLLQVGAIVPVWYAWNSTNATSCTITTLANGVTQTIVTGPTSGGALSGDIRYDTRFTLTCVNGAASAVATADVQVTARWYAVQNQSCGTFCLGIGKTNTQSPDAATGWPIPGGVTSTGSWCTSGEVIPPSAAKARDHGVLSYAHGCWWSCGGAGFWAGSDMHRGASVNNFCYGQKWSGGWQSHDWDWTDLTMGCYCSD